MKIAVTGATGFVGGALVRRLWAANCDVVPVVRLPQGIADERVVGDIGRQGAWESALEGIDVVVHLAGRAHVLRETASDPLEQFRRVNSAATRSLARSAASRGVRRLVFVSTIGVNGDATRPGFPFRADDPPHPEGAYAISKWEAEQELLAIAAETRLEVVIVRPPLIYGPAAKGRFASLAAWVRRGRPLPLKLVRNKRQFVAIDNLTDFLQLCASHPRASGETFLVADAESVSTAEFARRLASKMGRRPLFLPVPVALMWAGARLAGKEQAARGLLGSLEIDLDKNRRLLGWSPPLTLDQGLERAVSAGMY